MRTTSGPKPPPHRPISNSILSSRQLMHNCNEPANSLERQPYAPGDRSFLESHLSTWHTPKTRKKKAMETFRPAIAKVRGRGWTKPQEGAERAAAPLLYKATCKQTWHSPTGLGNAAHATLSFAGQRLLPRGADGLGRSWISRQAAGPGVISTARSLSLQPPALISESLQQLLGAAPAFQKEQVPSFCFCLTP